MCKQSNCALTFCIHWRLRKKYACLKKCCSSNVLCKHRSNVAFYKLSSCESENTRWGIKVLRSRYYQSEKEIWSVRERENRTNWDLPKYTIVVLTLQYGLYVRCKTVCCVQWRNTYVTAFSSRFFRERKTFFVKITFVETLRFRVSGRHFVPQSSVRTFSYVDLFVIYHTSANCW